MPCHLVHLTGPKAGEARSFAAARIAIGRASSCDFQFDPYENLMVASHHAEILYDEGIYFVHDLNTRGGTYVNGERITQRHPLRHEDFVQFGKNGPEIIFRLGPPKPGLQPLPPIPPETAELEFIAGADAGKLFPVYGDQVTRVGRRADLEVSLDPRGDMVISGNHCTISYEEEGFILTDTSRNGTFVNGEPVEGRAYLTDGDILTLGENGPQARFRVHPPRRVYPNLTGEFPRLTREQIEAATEADALRREAEIREAQQRQALASSEAVEESAGEPGEAGVQLPPPSPVAPVQIPPPSELIEPIHKLPLRFNLAKPDTIRRSKRPIIWFIASSCMLALIIFAISRIGGDGSGEIDNVSDDSNYMGQIRAGAEKRNEAGHFIVRVPQDWESLEQGPFLSIESPDKEVVVDYARDGRISADMVYRLLSRGNVQVRQLKSRKNGSLGQYTTFVTKTGTRSRLAILHQPKNDIPGFAFLEATNEAFAELSDRALIELLIERFQLQQLAEPAPEPTPTPAVSATPAATPLGEPPIDSLPRPTGTPETTPVPATPVPTAEVTPTPEPRPAPNVVSQAVNVSLFTPEGWTGEVDEENAIVTVSGPNEIEVKIARDPGKLNAEDVFSAMESEGWKSAGKSHSGILHAAELTQEGKVLRLYLIDQADGTTLVIYASKGEALTADESAVLKDIVKQLAEPVTE